MNLPNKLTLTRTKFFQCAPARPDSSAGPVRKV